MICSVQFQQRVGYHMSGYPGCQVNIILEMPGSPFSYGNGRGPFTEMHTPMQIFYCFFSKAGPQREQKKKFPGLDIDSEIVYGVSSARSAFCQFKR